MKTLITTLVACAATLAFPTEGFSANPPKNWRTEIVKAILLTDLAAFAGQKLTVLYVIGHKPLVSTDDRQMEVQEIKHVVGSLPISHGPIDLPQVEIPLQGFGPSYNFILFVNHHQPLFIWTNATGAIPIDPRNVTVTPETIPAVRVLAISKLLLAQLDRSQGSPTRIAIQF